MSSASLQRWEYRETGVALTPRPIPAEAPAPTPVAAPTFTEDQVIARVQQAVQEAEHRWATAAEEHETRRREQILTTMQAFAAERARYFQETESEVVHLALAISRKIIDREVSLDPDLLGALVRIALDRMVAGPAVKLRIPAVDFAHWQRQNFFAQSSYHCELKEDPSLTSGDCVVETDLGTANFSLDLQFKQIEQGMLDLLKLRPPSQPQTEHDNPSGMTTAVKDDR